ncbi:MAG: NIPSNAP family protein [Planctomycetota bacterium]|nr:NIPSNAP family protein [Planctomycetota bacterium]
MSSSLDRRQLLTGSATLGLGASLASAQPGLAAAQGREVYELRRYVLGDGGGRAALLEHLAGALLPALARVGGIGPVGVFVAAEDVEAAPAHDVHVLLPMKSVNTLLTLDDALAADGAFRAKTKAWDAGPAVYARVESRLLQAFRSIPVVELPAQTAERAPRLFELRTYESKNADAARRKVRMFDVGETQLMRDVELAPVFFGATRVGHDVPNLTYMLSAADKAAHDAHWKAFLTHPDWERMKGLPEFADTVSKITRWFLRPADCSQI